MAKKIFYKSDDSDSKLFAVLGMIPLVGYLIVYFTRKNDDYAMYYAKQGMILFIACIIVEVALWVVSWIPVIREMVGWVLNAFVLALFIIGIIYALSGKEKEVPILGEFAKKL